MTTTETEVLLPDLHLKQTIPIKNVKNCQNLPKMFTQRGDIWMLLCLQRGGHENFSEKLIVIGVFHRSCQNAKNYQLFLEKIFGSPCCKHSNTQMSPAPVACPVRHLTTHNCIIKELLETIRILGSSTYAKCGHVFHLKRSSRQEKTKTVDSIVGLNF